MAAKRTISRAQSRAFRGKTGKAKKLKPTDKHEKESWKKRHASRIKKQETYAAAHLRKPSDGESAETRED